MGRRLPFLFLRETLKSLADDCRYHLIVRENEGFDLVDNVREGYGRVLGGHYWQGCRICPYTGVAQDVSGCNPTIRLTLLINAPTLRVFS